MFARKGMVLTLNKTGSIFFWFYDCEITTSAFRKFVEKISVFVASLVIKPQTGSMPLDYIKKVQPSPK